MAGRPRPTSALRGGIMETRTLRFDKTVGGRYEVRPGVFDVYGYAEGEVVDVPAELAASFIGSGAHIAEAFQSPRTIEVETATREPRSERAMRRRR